MIDYLVVDAIWFCDVTVDHVGVDESLLSLPLLRHLTKRVHHPQPAVFIYQEHINSKVCGKINL